MNSNSADTTINRGNVTFNLRNSITLPKNVVGYVSLSELTMPNTKYNINSANNKLVLTDKSITSILPNTKYKSAINTTFSLKPGNYTVTSLKASTTQSLQLG